VPVPPLGEREVKFPDGTILVCDMEASSKFGIIHANSLIG
jgi:hypothetical protein